MDTTNVKPSQLNYDKYNSEKYDKDIVNSIPFHRQIHSLMVDFAKNYYQSEEKQEILDLGVGTAITSRLVKDVLPNAHFDLVDFSRQMLRGAKEKMGSENVDYIFGDYSKLKLKKKYDIVICVIGLHHQNHAGKKKMFKKIYGLLKPKGVFLFADLITYKNEKEAALNQAKHFKHLADTTEDDKTLSEWAYHHLYLNDLAPIENQIKWLKDAGFKVDKKFLQFNTALLICKKS